MVWQEPTRRSSSRCFRRLKATLQLPDTETQTLYDTLYKLGQQVDVVRDQLTTFWATASGIFGSLTTALSGISEGGLNIDLSGITQALQPFRDVIAAVWEWLGVSEYVTQVTNFLSIVFQELGTDVKTIVDAFNRFKETETARLALQALGFVAGLLIGAITFLIGGLIKLFATIVGLEAFSWVS